MAAPLSITKLIGVSIVVVAMIMIGLPMIQQAFTPPGTGASSSNAQASNVTCSTITPNTLANASNQYQNAQCLIITLYGYNASLSTGSQYGKIFSLTNSVSFGTNYTGSNSVNQTGFFVNIFQFTGLSFVFSGIGTIIEVMQTLGQVAQVLFTTLWLWLPPFESIVIINIIKLITFYIYLRIIMIGISAWMKYSILDS